MLIEPAPDHQTRKPAPGLRSRLRRQALVFSALFCGVLFGLSLLLVGWRVEQMLSGLSQDRTERAVRQVADDAENALRLGLATDDLDFLTPRLDALRAQQPELRAVFVRARDGRDIAASGQSDLRSRIEARWNTRLLQVASRSAEVRNVPGLVLTGGTVVDAAGAPAATVWAAVDPGPVRAEARDAALGMVVRAVPLVGLSFGVVYLLLIGWGWQTVGLLRQARGDAVDADSRAPSSRLLPLLVATLAVAPLGLVWIAREAARPHVTEQLETNARNVAVAGAGRLDQALTLGVPLTSLVGVDALFRERLAAAPELSSLALRGADGATVVSVAQPGAQAAADAAEAPHERAAPVGTGGAQVVAGVPADFVDRALGAMLVDLVLALVISAVLVRELTRGLWRGSLLYPLLDYRLARFWVRATRWRSRRRTGGAAAEDATLAAAAERCDRVLSADGGRAPRDEGSFGPQLTRLRLAVFLVALSDELLRPFFTVFASEMPAGSWSLSPALVAGLPVAAFMATLALAQPLGPALARRFDLRHSLMAAALLGTAALVATAFTRDALLLVLVRAASGAAYGLALILIQTAIVRGSTAAQRARSLGEVAAAIVAAGIVGPPFGGMIAGRVGDGLAVLGCALCMGAALFTVSRLRLGSRSAENPARPAGTGGWRGYAAVLRNPRAMAVILGSAVPARLVAVTVLVVVVPLYMRGIDQPAAIAGRVMLLYFLFFACTAPLMSHWSDAAGRRTPFVVAGCLLAGVACWLLPALGGVAGMAVCCALLGAAQATQSSPQLALVTEIFEHGDHGPHAATPEQALAAFRLIERVGSIAAPFATALAVALLGMTSAVAAVGVFVAAAGLLLWLAMRGHEAPNPLGKPT